MVSVPITVLQYNSQLLSGSNVAIKGLSVKQDITTLTHSLENCQYWIEIL